ncbi:MAG: sugar phosphate isomerase/epimerase [Mucilaginibacter polytrichastri]|nr:sugar phosphate isomerase/epimerase [Mucilaginibacter polytrichastri]
MNKKMLLAAGFMLLLLTTVRAQTPETKLGWKLGSQAYTFRLFTFAEALDKIDSCNLKYVEMFPGQTIGGGVEGKMDYHMDAATRAKVLKLAKDKGITIYAYGVVGADNEADWKALFEFAKAMGIKTITSEPKEEDLPLISKLADQYKVNVAIHNHPNPSHYWNPDIVLAALKGQSKRIGACADIGHWVRSGLDPIECLKKLEGHVFHSHMKDLNEKGNREAHDLVWGTGVSNIPAVIAELKRQKFNGMISAEYEYHWENNAPEVKASAEFFRQTVAKTK